MPKPVRETASRVHLSPGLIAAVALAILFQAGRAEAGPNEEARAYSDKATAAFALAKYAVAAENFEKAFELRPDPALLYNAAQAHQFWMWLHISVGSIGVLMVLGGVQFVLRRGPILTADADGITLSMTTLDRSHLPPVQPSDRIAGYLVDVAAEQLGLAAGIPVVTGAADTACSGRPSSSRSSPRRVSAWRSQGSAPSKAISGSIAVFGVSIRRRSRASARAASE